MPLIENYISQYTREIDYYSKLAEITSNKIKTDINKRGIKAIVTYRAKSVESLKNKIIKRNKKTNYQNMQDIYDDIIDLAGVRIALYFPADREEVDDMIKEIFEVKTKKEIPEESHDTCYKKSFSGYWATHYRVKLDKKKTDESLLRYSDSIVEIQVASLLMHSWSEIEHDIAYKPIDGEPSKEELAILDELNGLIIAGEIALERLQKATNERVAQKSDNIDNNYELTSFIKNYLYNNYKDQFLIGRTENIQKLLTLTNTNKANLIKNYLKYIDKNIDESISDQLIEIIFSQNAENKEFLNRLESLGKEKREQQRNGISYFLKRWIILEKCLSKYASILNLKKAEQRFIPKHELIMNMVTFNEKEVYELNKIRKLRNKVVNGIEILDDDILIEEGERLEYFINKLFKQIGDDDFKKESRKLL